MPTLTIFRVLGKHLVGLWGGLYMAAGIAHFVGWFWPDARSVAFLTAGAFFASLEISMTIRELRRGPMSTGLIILDCLSVLTLWWRRESILGSASRAVARIR
jgi:hypothetical protein